MKTIIVTGASRGIGRCIAENLAKEGNHVIANYNKSEKEAKELKTKLEKEGIFVDIYKADVSKREEAASLIEFAVNKFDKIDVLINNAGIAKMQMFSDVTEEDWDEMINTNLKSAFYCSQKALEHKVHEKNELITNISSVRAIGGG